MYMVAEAPNLIVAALADLVWPRRCAACDRRLPVGAVDPAARAFCSVCADSLLHVGSPRCPICGLTHGAGLVDHRCAACLADPPAFETARAPYLYGYGGALADAISRLKYTGSTWLADPLGALLASAEPAARPDLVVPVPLHRRRLVERGYNQSALLAARLARRLGAPLEANAIQRIADTPPQARQARHERLAALRGAFAPRSGRRLTGERVLLVDDVVTTTATVRAATRALLRAGAGTVEVVSLARAEWSARVADRRQTG
jgi:ComF family protein